MENEKPDIILIIADDINYDILKKSNSPYLKSLMSSGLNFSNAYNYGANNGAVCKVSRNMMFFGKAWDNKSSNNKAFPSILKNNGYITFATGKWHNSESLFYDCFTDYKDIYWGGMISKKSSIAFPSSDKVLGERLPGGVFSNSLVNFIKKSSVGHPYFAYIGFTEPHDPLRLINDGYNNIAELPKNYSPNPTIRFGQMKNRDEKLMKRPLNADKLLNDIRKYMSMISYLDNCIANIIKTLTRTTVIIFTTDNGICKGNHGLLGKQNLFQESIHVPLILWSNDKSLIKCSQLDKPVYLYDIYPTILNLTGIDNTENLSKIRKAQCLTNVNKRKYLLFRYKNLVYAIIKNGWKLIVYPKIKIYQLFNLDNDPYEINPLKYKESDDLTGKFKTLNGLINKFYQLKKN